MKRLDRYVIKELAVPLLIGTIIFALLFVANDMIAIYKNFNVDSIPPLAIVQLLLFKFPQWLSLTLPIGMTLGASLCISRLARESELTAMRAAGIPVLRVFLPVIIVGALISVTNFYIIERLIPPATKSYRKLINEVGILAAMPQFKSNVMLSIDRFTASFGSIRRASDNVIGLNDILLVERPRSGEVILYKAETGTYSNGIWTIKAPVIFRMKGSTLIAAESKSNVPIYEPIRVGDLFAPPMPEEESSRDLLEAIRLNREAKQNTTGLEIAFHQKFSGPASCLIFALAGAVVSMRMSKAGPFMGVLVSLALVWLYFNIYIVSAEILGKHSWVAPALSAWAPNIIFALTGIMLLRRLE